MKFESEKATVEVGKAFANALVSGKYLDAHALLSIELQSECSPETLEAEYNEMVSYGDGQAEVDGHYEFLHEWPYRQPNDIGWAYISITGQDYAEAVTVVVSNEGGIPKIRELEWGRP